LCHIRAKHSLSARFSPKLSTALTGMGYVVKSLSEDPEIRKLDGLLHKIGFTSGKM
jgi:hypothetical protein